MVAASDRCDLPNYNDVNRHQDIRLICAFADFTDVAERNDMAMDEIYSDDSFRPTAAGVNIVSGAASSSCETLLVASLSLVMYTLHHFTPLFVDETLNHKP